MPGKNLRRIGLAIVVSAFLLAAAPPQPKTPVVPMVTVVKTDGTSVRGQLVSADPDKVVVKPAAKLGVKSATAPSDVELTWKDIKTVSNGLTYAKALAAWKQEHLADLCEQCHGERTMLCPTCKGTMHDPASGKDCKTCKGELLVDCKAPKCKEGKTPCPAPCIKLTEGRWYMKDGKKWRDFHFAGGLNASVSEGHAGQVFDANGQLAGECPTCGGKTVIDCPTCKGIGKVPCPTCSARKDAPPCPDKCDHGRVTCDKCKGTGLKS